MSSAVCATRGTCLQGIRIYISKSIVTALLFLPVIVLPPPLLCFFLPLLPFASPGDVLYPAILRLSFLVHRRVIAIVPADPLFASLLRLCSTQYRYFLLAGSGSRGAFH